MFLKGINKIHLLLPVPTVYTRGDIKTYICARHNTLRIPGCPCVCAPAYEPACLCVVRVCVRKCVCVVCVYGARALCGGGSGGGGGDLRGRLSACRLVGFLPLCPAVWYAADRTSRAEKSAARACVRPVVRRASTSVRTVRPSLLVILASVDRTPKFASTRPVRLSAGRTIKKRKTYRTSA